jgi:hypothetical protein
VAAQDKVVSKKYFKNKTLKEEIDSTCHLCKEHAEIFVHLTSGCPTL